MKLLSWNIARLSYGIIEHEKPKLINAIIDKVNSINADVVVLTEVPPGKKSCGEFLERLQDLHYSGEITYPTGYDKKGLVLIITKDKNDTSGEIREKKIVEIEEGFLYKKFLEKNIDNEEIKVIGVHVPIFEKCPIYCVNRGKKCKWRYNSSCRRYYDIFWNKLFAESNANSTILMGDFNGCITLDDYNTKVKRKILDNNLIKLCNKRRGWIDAWLTADNKDKGERFTWQSASNNGRRLDYAFISPNLERTLVSAKHIACKGLSDHSALIIELDLSKL